MIGPHDLLAQFVQYPGHADAAYSTMPNVHRPNVDERIIDGRMSSAALGAIEVDLTRTLQSGGRVFVAVILDPQDRDAPWMNLLGRGTTKPQIRAALLHHRTVERLADVGGIQLWQLHADAATP